MLYQGYPFIFALLFLCLFILISSDALCLFVSLLSGLASIMGVAIIKSFISFSYSSLGPDSFSFFRFSSSCFLCSVLNYSIMNKF